MVALVDRAGAQAGEIGAGARLGITLTPDLVAAEDRWQIPFFLRLGAPMNEGGAEKAHADRARQDRRAGAEILLVEDYLLHKAGAAAAIFLWPGQADPAGRVHPLLPGAALFERLAVGGDALVLRVLDLEIVREIGVEPSAKLTAEFGVVRRIGEIHGRGPPEDRGYRPPPPGSTPGGPRLPAQVLSLRVTEPRQHRLGAAPNWQHI